MSTPYVFVHHDDITPEQRRAIIDLCTRAYEEDFTTYFDSLKSARHLLLYEGDALASHACWIDRWLQQGTNPPLHTAYVEAVATEEHARRKGYATSLMRAIAEMIADYPFAALGAAEPEFYERLGWRPWTGPLSVRPQAPGMEPEIGDDEGVMYLPTASMPHWINPTQPLSCEWRDAPELW